MKHMPSGREATNTSDSDIAVWSSGQVRISAGLRDDLDLGRFDAVEVVPHEDHEALELRFYIGEEHTREFKTLGDSIGTPRICTISELRKIGKEFPDESIPVDHRIMDDGRILIDVSELNNE